MRKILVVLICLLAVFAVVSCKNDPAGSNQESESGPKPTSEDVLAGNAYYRLTATRGAQRFALVYSEEEDFTPEQGSVLTCKYRTDGNKTVNRLFIRDESEGKYLRDGEGKGLKYHDILEIDDPYVSAPDEDGWISFSFTFPEMINPDKDNTPFSGIRLEFVNTDGFADGDYIEIKDLALDGVRLTIEGPAKKADAEEYQSGCGIWNFGKNNNDHTWPILKMIFI